MTPKEKALELVNKFLEEMPYGSLRDFNDTKECALICVDETIITLSLNKHEILSASLNK